MARERLLCWCCQYLAFDDDAILYIHLHATSPVNHHHRPGLMIYIPPFPLQTQTDDHGYTAIMWSCDRGRLELLKLLLAQGADPTGRDILDYNGMMMACHYGWSGIVGHLLHHHHDGDDDDINTTTAEGNYSALYIAAKNGHEEVVGLLLRAGADPTLEDDQGRDALQRARTFGHTGVAQMLEVSGG